MSEFMGLPHAKDCTVRAMLIRSCLTAEDLRTAAKPVQLFHPCVACLMFEVLAFVSCMTADTVVVC